MCKAEGNNLWTAVFSDLLFLPAPSLSSAQWAHALCYLLPAGLPMLTPGMSALQGWKRCTWGVPSQLVDQSHLLHQGRYGKVRAASRRCSREGHNREMERCKGSA